MRMLGIIGGMSWESTAQYYTLINKGVRDRLGGLHSAPLLVSSYDFAAIEELQTAGKWDELGTVLTDTARSLERAGAEGILMATRFIATHECQVHENVRQELVRRRENETVLYGNSIGLQGRALINESMKKVMEIEAKGGSLEEILPHISGQYGDKIWNEGNMDIGLIPVGQSMGLIHEVMSCKELLDGITKEAEEILDQVKAKF